MVPFFALLSGLVIVFIPAAAYASKWLNPTFPIPIQVERVTFRSELYLSFPLKQYGIPLREFDAMSLNAEELALKELIEGVRTKNYSLAAKRIRRKDELATDQGLRKYVNSFHDSLQDFTDILVMGQIPSGRRVRFVLRGTTRNGTSVRIFTFSKNRYGQYVYDVEASFGVVDSLINEIYLNSAIRPKDFAPLPANRHPSFVPSLHHYHIPYGDTEQTEAQSVRLYFRGQPVDINIMDESKLIKNPVLAFYQRAYLAFKAGELEVFFRNFTPQGHKKIDQAFSRMSTEQLTQYRKNVTIERHVRFLLDANPVYIVFYTEGKSSNLEGELLRYEYIIKNEQGRFKIANPYVNVPLDQLWDNSRFQDLALKPIIDDYLKKQRLNDAAR